MSKILTLADMMAEIAAHQPARTDYYAERNIWNTMRNLRQFTARELEAHGATDTVPVSQAQAEKFLRFLLAVGLAAEAGQKGRPHWGSRGKKLAGVYRLLPSANTGPEPPQRFVARVLFDPNRKAVLGLTQAAGGRA